MSLPAIKTVNLVMILFGLFVSSRLDGLGGQNKVPWWLEGGAADHGANDPPQTNVIHCSTGIQRSTRDEVSIEYNCFELSIPYELHHTQDSE